MADAVCSLAWPVARRVISSFMAHLPSWRMARGDRSPERLTAKTFSREFCCNRNQLAAGLQMPAERRPRPALPARNAGFAGRVRFVASAENFRHGRPGNRRPSPMTTMVRDRLADEPAPDRIAPGRDASALRLEEFLPYRLNV